MQPTLEVFVPCVILSLHHSKLSLMLVGMIVLYVNVKSLACIIANAQVNNEIRNSIIAI